MSSMNDIRATFLDYFKNNDHQQVSSSPLVPQNDPTLLFTNAGMVQFKDLFTGKETRPYNRAATSQKCVRAGGKHNDLENVGYTARHHTFFEMLGNFSFGDYFKEKAIFHAWDLITRVYGIAPEKLLVTVYAEDVEARALWKKIAGLPDDKIISIATTDNFWSMGDTGPCGPCTEIFYDHGNHIAGGPPGSPDEDGDRFVEIWNLVFMQYERQADGELIDLPKPSVDTGMGLERITAVMQGVHNNYETDLFLAIIDASIQAAGVENIPEHLVSHRVIADHLRASCFLIADGVMPSNEGRGYVLRRIMRRAMRHAHIIGCRQTHMWKLVRTLVSLMGGAFPELVRAEALITETLRTEEERFKQTLGRGLKLLNEEISTIGASGILSGHTAFKLYDTYGFPLDLTQDILRGHDMAVEMNEFDAAMAEQKARARAAWEGSGDQETEKLWFELYDKIGASDFLGYQTESAEGSIAAIIKDGNTCDTADVIDETYMLLTNQTPFYGESGGQVGDKGMITADNGLVFEVTDTQKKAGKLHIHIGTLKAGSLRKADTVQLKVDHTHRTSLRAHHSATHLLHEVLRRHLGEHVTQKGSRVDAHQFRFDFSHSKSLTAHDIEVVEQLVNNLIRQNSDVYTQQLSMDDAIKDGAMALFGEKYDEEVRVVSMGTPERAEKAKRAYSIELCGGTHVNRTGDIGLFKITSEGAVASGIRRIEAVCGKYAEDYMRTRDQTLQAIALKLKSSPAALADKVDALIEERRKLRKELEKAKLSGGAGAEADITNDISGITLITRKLAGVEAKHLKPIVNEMTAKIKTGVAVAVAENEGKASIVIGVTDDLTDKLSAVDLVRAAASHIGSSGGGGRPEMAQSGGPDASKLDDALAAIADTIAL